MRAVKFITLHKGESWSDLFSPTPDRGFTITETHSCDLTVKQGTATKLSKTITDSAHNDTYYKPSLTATETTNLGAGTFKMILNITDSSGDSSYQRVLTLRIVE